MIDLPYSLVIEATADPGFFGFYCPDLPGFSGVGHSVEDCLYKARWGIKDHMKVMRQRRLRVPAANSNPTIIIQNQSPPKRKSA
jgi:predicted RNase H-like HicB family nuclease